jgi:DNA-binding NarL/FixJ family response regulator
MRITKDLKVKDGDAELVRYVADGYTAKEIGDKMKLPKRTIEDKKRRLMDKCGCSSFAEVVALFFRNKLID